MTGMHCGQPKLSDMFLRQLERVIGWSHPAGGLVLGWMMAAACTFRPSSSSGANVAAEKTAACRRSVVLATHLPRNSGPPESTDRRATESRE